MRPIIGIILDWQDSGTFSKRPHYALRHHYFDAVIAAGGLPVAIPYDADNIDEYINLFDGLLSPGGNYASPENWYIEDNGKSSYAPSPRVEFEIKLVKATLKSGKPVLGICAGMQTMGAMFGCQMTQNIHKYLDTKIDHLNEQPAEKYAYDAQIKKDTYLHKIIGKDTIPVNTAHREAIVNTPDNIIINATAPDGCILGIEITDYPFAIGVQWHPEFFIGETEKNHLKIIEELVKQAKKVKLNNLK